jgi:hypothetical protein
VSGVSCIWLFSQLMVLCTGLHLPPIRACSSGVARRRHIARSARDRRGRCIGRCGSCSSRHSRPGPGSTSHTPASAENPVRLTRLLELQGMGDVITIASSASVGTDAELVEATRRPGNASPSACGDLTGDDHGCSPRCDNRRLCGSHVFADYRPNRTTLMSSRITLTISRIGHEY